MRMECELMRMPRIKEFLFATFEYHSQIRIIATSENEGRVTVPDGQFKWGACLLKSNGGVYQG